MPFYIAIILFITSCIGALALVILNKNMARERFLLLASIHLVLLLAFVASIIIRAEKVVEGRVNYLLLLFICSGVLLSAVSWRSRVAKPVRIYFSIYLLTLPLFLFSPSMLVNLLLTGRYSDTTGSRYALGNRYFIETQSTVMKEDSVPHYKLIRKKGMFHQTICRDIVFNGKLDSIRVLEISENDHITVRGFVSINTYVSTDIDSTDVTLPLQKRKQNEIEYRL